MQSLNNVDQTILDTISLAMVLKNGVGSLNIIASLKTLSEEAWEESKDEFTGNHLIKGVSSSSAKTTLIQSYVSKLVKLYLISERQYGLGCSKVDLVLDNFKAQTLTDKLAISSIASEENLFIKVMTSILGFEEALVRAAISKNEADKATYVTRYLIGQVDELPTKFDEEPHPFEDPNDFFNKKLNEYIKRDYNYEELIIFDLMGDGVNEAYSKLVKVISFIPEMVREKADMGYPPIQHLINAYDLVIGTTE